MSKFISRILIILVLSMLLTACVELQKKDTEEGVEHYYRVVHVVDGDTIDVDIDGQKERVRLLGIDTPETVDPRRKVECFGVEASKKMKELVSGRSVKLEADSTQANRDKYNRLLRYVYLKDGTFINKVLVRDGFADRFYSSPRCKQADVFKTALDFAKQNKLGLWAKGACK